MPARSNRSAGQSETATQDVAEQGRKGLPQGLITSESETRTRLISVATRLFAQHGFDGASVRMITRESGANLGAINYHFESKEGLIREVFRSLARPVNEMRLSELDRYEQEAGSGRLELKRVAYALVAPAIRFASDPTMNGFYLLRLIVLARTLPRPFMTSVIADEYDMVFHRFVAAIGRAMPHLTREQVCWRYSFSIGALLHAAGYYDGYDRIERLSGGLCRADEVEVLIDELVTYVTAGLSGSFGQENRGAAMDGDEGRLP